VADTTEPQDQIDAEKQAKADDAMLFAKLKGWVKESLDQHADWYKEAEECFGFVAGRGSGSAEGKGQWPGTSWQDMLDSGRQPIEFNRVGPIVDAICGLEINNRQEIKYLPRTQGDVAVNERLSSLGEWARDEANAEDEESEMFRNAVVCGRGATETRIDFSEEPTGKIVIDNLDPMECGVDPAARKQALTDRRYSWRFRDMPTDEAKALFDGVESVALNATWAGKIGTTDGGQGNKTDYPDETRPGMRDSTKPKTVRVVQIEWWEQECSYMVAVPGSDQPQEISEDAWTLLQEQSAKLKPEEQPKGQKIDRRCYKKAFLGKNAVIDVSEIACFQINWATGRYDRNRGYHYGVVRPMRDPQMLSNKTLSQVLHILNTNAKGGIIIEKGVFANPRDAEKDWSNPAKTITVNEGGLEKIKDRTSPAIPPALVQLQEFSLSSIRDVTGASVEMLGLADRDQPASLEYQRRQSAMTILASLFNGLRHYRKNQGKTLLEQLKLLPPGVLVRVLIDPEVAQQQFAAAMAQWAQQPPVQQYLAMAQQAQAQGQPPPPPPPGLPPQPEPPGSEFLSKTKVGEQFDPAKFGLGPDARFDVIVDETPSSPNQKEATWAAIQPFMDSLPPSAIPIALKASPLPESVADELGKAIAGGGQPQVPPELQQLVEQGKARIQELETENARLKDDRQVEAAKVGVNQQDADTRRLKVAGDQHIAAMDQRLNQLTSAVESLVSVHQAIGGAAAPGG
jgi:hypothetical protein